MKEFGITETKNSYQNRSTPSFIVRLGWKDRKYRVYKEFLFVDEITREIAKQEAIMFRDAELKKLKDAGEWPAKVIYKKPFKNSKSKILGVHRSRVYAGKRPGSPKKLNCYCWVASWYKDGNKCTASFGETKWGADMAKQMACDCREAKNNIYSGL